MEKVSASQENYIKLIWHLEQKQKKAAVQTLARLYGVSPPTVSAMLRQLMRLGMIDYDRRIGARLTTEGERLARKLVRKHRLLESFLQQVLKMDELSVHEEAELLEHAVSDRLIHTIDDFLGNPTTDPHGSFIPEWDAQMTPVPLSAVSEEQSFRVKTILLSAKMKRYLNERNFKPGTMWRLEEQAPGKTSFLITDGKRYIALAASDAEKILVYMDGEAT